MIDQKETYTKNYSELKTLALDLAKYAKISMQEAEDFLESWILYKKQMFENLDKNVSLKYIPKESEFLEKLKISGLPEQTAKDVLMASLQLDIKLNENDYWVGVVWEENNIYEILRASDLKIVEN